MGHYLSEMLMEMERNPQDLIWGPDPNQLKWDKYFLEMARFVSTRSKDPSTQCGAVIVDENRRLLSTGYNGFAQGVEDRPEWYNDRNKKLELVIHCEVNAVIFAQRNNLRGCTLYTYPFGCCSRCAAIMIQVGLRRFVFPPMPEHIKPRWGDSLVLAAQQFKDVGAELIELKLET